MERATVTPFDDLAKYFASNGIDDRRKLKTSDVLQLIYGLHQQYSDGTTYDYFNNLIDSALTYYTQAQGARHE